MAVNNHVDSFQGDNVGRVNTTLLGELIKIIINPCGPPEYCMYSFEKSADIGEIDTGQSI